MLLFDINLKFAIWYNFLRCQYCVIVTFISIKDRPAAHVGTSNEVKIRAKTSAANTGTWRAQFQFVLQEGKSKTLYRVTIQVVTNLPLTLKERLHFS